jgi:hypothetical protein
MAHAGLGVLDCLLLEETIYLVVRLVSYKAVGTMNWDIQHLKLLLLSSDKDGAHARHPDRRSNNYRWNY